MSLDDNKTGAESQACGGSVGDQREGVEMYRELVEGLPDRIMRFDPAGRHLYVSKNVSEIVNIPARDFIGKTHEELGFPKEMCALCKRCIRRVVESGEALTEEFSYAGINGSAVFEWRLIPEFDDAGHVKSVLAVSRDVTSEQREQHIEDAKLRIIQLAATCSMTELLQRLVDAVEAVTQSSIGFLHFVEEDEQTILLQAWSTNTLETMCDLSMQGHRYSLRDGGVWLDCIRERDSVVHNDYAKLKHKKGIPEGHPAVKRELLVPVFREGRIVAVVGVGNKPTDYNDWDVRATKRLIDFAWEIIVRLRAEEALSASAERLRLALACSNDGVFDWKVRTGEVVFDSRYYSMAGYEPFEFPGTYEEWEKRVHPDDLAATVQAVNDYLSGRIENYDVEFRFRRKTGDWMWIRARVRITERDADGQPLRAVGTHTDTTRQKEAELTGERLNAQLRRQNRALEQLVYMTSHDLRSPLLNIGGHIKEIEIALSDFRGAITEPLAPGAAAELTNNLLERDLAESMQYIRTSVSRMDTLLDGLLQLSRSGRVPLSVCRVDMDALLSRIVETEDVSIKSSGAKVMVSPLPLCQSDPHQLEQVFANLLENALKYLDPNRPGEVRISGERQAEWSVYCVEDNGIGIDPHHHEAIFDVCRRLEPSKNKGDGLGLTIVRQVVERLGGSVRLESEVGKGSRFFVQLPAR